MRCIVAKISANRLFQQTISNVILIHRSNGVKIHWFLSYITLYKLNSVRVIYPEFTGHNYEQCIGSEAQNRIYANVGI